MRALDASTTTAIGQPTTKPYYLVELGFGTALYYSSRGNISWDSKSWDDAPIEVSDSSITVFNAGTTFGQVVLSDGTAGRSITIYKGDAGDSAHPNPVMVFDGEMGDAIIGDYVSIDIKRTPPLRSPRFYCVPPTFNHLPRAGTRFETPSGTITLEGY